ncbi:MAG: chloride channel protein [Bryobacteraceae bacterium]
MSPTHRYEDKVLLLLTLIIGAVVGLVVVAFILVTENLGARLYPGSVAAWRRLVIPVGGALITGILLTRYFPNARGSGIPQTKTALFVRDGFISMRTVIGKFSMSAVSLASGIALGREGPSVQVSAGIASVLGRKLGLSASSVKALLPVGASAALAAAFNTPIAAVLFTLEEVMGDMHAPVLGSIVLASATSWIVLHLLLGDEPLFHVPAYQLVHPLEFLAYAVLGVAGGLVSVGFVKLLLWQRKYFLRLPKVSLWWQPAVGGLVVGILGWFFPDVLGVGYNYVDQALNGGMVLRTMALLVLLKVVATATCYASGNAGGIFGPSLFIGAMLGGAVGGVAHQMFPDYTGSVGAYALVGMGTAFAGIVRVPMTSVIMIFEITRDYSIIVPLMISNLISYFISSRLQEESIYEALLHQDGIHLPSGAKAREALLMVGQAYRQTPESLPVSLRVSEAAASVRRETEAWPVVDPVGLRGMLTLERLDRAVAEGQGERTLGDLVPAPKADGLMAQGFPHLHSDHSLDYAMRRLAETGLKALPVVSRTNVRELKGTISMPDILAAYAMGKVELEAGPALPKDRPVALLAGVLAVLIVLGIVGGLLSYYYHSEREGRAQHFYDLGNQFMQKDLYDEAIEQYRDALSIAHSNQNRLALALALVKAGQPEEASIYLKDLLRNDPNNAPANLGMARVAVQKGSIDEALVYYHHAVYGAWPSNAPAHRAEARIELIRMLDKAGRRQQAHVEVLAMLTMMPGDISVKRQVAPLAVEYDLPKEAAALFRDLTERDPQDEPAWAGLGDAEYVLGDFGPARDALSGALRLNPNDTAVQKRLDAVNQILALDPTQRGLGAAQRYERSQAVLAEVLDVLDKCDAKALPAVLKDQIESTRRLLVKGRRPASYGDATEHNTSLAEQLWTAGQKACGSLPPADAPLTRVMARLMAR